MNRETLEAYDERLGKTLGAALIAPTKIYVRSLRSIREAGIRVHACSHITGGGFYENVPRMLKDGTLAVIEKRSYCVPELFRLIAEKGNVSETVMYNTFNMGIGMVLAVREQDVDKAAAAIRAAGEQAFRIGRIVSGRKGVELI